MATICSKIRVLVFVFAFLSFSQRAWPQDSGDESSKYYDDIAAGTVGDEGDSKFEEETPVDTPPQAGEANAQGIEGDSAKQEKEQPGEGKTAQTQGQGSESESQSRDLKPWEKGAERHHLSLEGSTGLFYILEAGSDKSGTFGIGLHGAFFRYGDYLYADDDDTYMWSGLDLRITPVDFLEIYAGFEITSNHNTAVRPELLQSIGDFQLGLKAFFQPVDWITVGGLVGGDVKSPVGEVALTFEGLSVDLGVASTFDFSKLSDRAPIRAHFNLIYLFDRSANLIDDLEIAEGGCDSDANGDGTADYQGCLNPVERLALGINRTDQMRIGIGLDALFPYFSPIIEYLIDIPVNRQDFSCPEYVAYSSDSCMAKEGFQGMRQWVTLGMRFLLPVDSLAVDVGADIGTAGYAPPVHEIAPQTPYRILFGLSYNFDPFPETPECPIEQASTTPAKVESRSYILGYVHDADEPGRPVSGAVVSYTGYDVTSQLSDPQGVFTSPLLSPRMVVVEISAQGYNPGSFTLEIPEPAAEGGAAIGIKLDCPLKPARLVSSLVVRVIDPEGNPLGDAALVLKGPEEARVATDLSGRIERDMAPGAYSMLVEKEGYLKKLRTLNLSAGIRTNIEVQLIEKPTETSVVISKKQIVIKKKIHFATDSDEIELSSFGLLDEVADLLFSNPELKRIEIQGHTDNRGKRDYNLDLSGRRAESVRLYLIKAGVAEERLEAKGLGPDRPISPNITSQGRATNRRVEFHILERE
jgi:outer membrane protein OmpA-like peptidoglycan-associated protein